VYSDFIVKVQDALLACRPWLKWLGAYGIGHRE